MVASRPGGWQRREVGSGAGRQEAEPGGRRRRRAAGGSTGRQEAVPGVRRQYQGTGGNGSYRVNTSGRRQHQAWAVRTVQQETALTAGLESGRGGSGLLEERKKRKTEVKRDTKQIVLLQRIYFHPFHFTTLHSICIGSLATSFIHTYIALTLPSCHTACSSLITHFHSKQS